MIFDGNDSLLMNSDLSKTNQFQFIHKYINV